MYLKDGDVITSNVTFPKLGKLRARGENARGVPPPSVLRLRILTFLSFALNF
jgi:hypothetical protein